MADKVAGLQPKQMIRAPIPLWMECSCGGKTFVIGFANSEGWMPVARCSGCDEVSLIPREPPSDIAMRALTESEDVKPRKQ